MRLAGGVPRFAPCEAVEGVWRLDRDALASAVGPRTRAFLMMSPAMPSGAVMTREDWAVVCEACQRAGAWMIYDSAMERILFDGLEPIHPASFPGMSERTITVGAATRAQRERHRLVADTLAEMLDAFRPGEAAELPGGFQRRLGRHRDGHRWSTPNRGP